MDAFDHLVRSPEEFERLRRYIAENPATAGLSPGEYLCYTKDRRA
jgi:putative transposase